MTFWLSNFDLDSQTSYYYACHYWDVRRNVMLIFFFFGCHSYSGGRQLLASRVMWWGFLVTQVTKRKDKDPLWRFNQANRWRRFNQAGTISVHSEFRTRAHYHKSRTRMQNVIMVLNSERKWHPEHFSLYFEASFKPPVTRDHILLSDHSVKVEPWHVRTSRWRLWSSWRLLYQQNCQVRMWWADYHA